MSDDFNKLLKNILGDKLDAMDQKDKLSRWMKLCGEAAAKQRDQAMYKSLCVEALTMSIDNTKRCCPKCKSTNIKHQVWGRVEYDVCTDCLTEVP